MHRSSSAMRCLNAIKTIAVLSIITNGGIAWKTVSDGLLPDIPDIPEFPELPETRIKPKQ